MVGVVEYSERYRSRGHDSEDGVPSYRIVVGEIDRRMTVWSGCEVSHGEYYTTVYHKSQYQF